MQLHSVIVGFIMNILRLVTGSCKKQLSVAIIKAFLRYIVAFVPLLQNIKERSLIIRQIINDTSTMVNKENLGEDSETHSKDVFNLLKLLIQLEM